MTSLLKALSMGLMGALAVFTASYFALPAWEESPLFTPKERAVLKLTDEITLITQEGLREKHLSKCKTPFFRPGNCSDDYCH